MKGGQQALKLKTPHRTGRFSDWPSGRSAARARHAQGQQRGQSLGGWLLGRLHEFGRKDPEKFAISSKGKAWGDGSLAVPANSAGRTLRRPRLAARTEK